MLYCITGRHGKEYTQKKRRRLCPRLLKNVILYRMSWTIYDIHTAKKSVTFARSLLYILPVSAGTGPTPGLCSTHAINNRIPHQQQAPSSCTVLYILVHRWKISRQCSSGLQRLKNARKVFFFFRNKKGVKRKTGCIILRCRSS
jgi:hypothetical protein